MKSLHGTAKPSANALPHGPKTVLEKLPQLLDKEEMVEPMEVESLQTQKKSGAPHSMKEFFDEDDTHDDDIRSFRREFGRRLNHGGYHPESNVTIRMNKGVANGTPEKVSDNLACDGSRSIEIQELAKHCTPQDAWTAIHGIVFDISSYIVKHPGGPCLIRSIIGKDGTQAFGSQA